MTLDRQGKRAAVPLGNSPGKEIPHDILATESRYCGIYCLVEGALVLVRPDDEPIEIAAEEGAIYIGYVQWIGGQRDRVHATLEQATDFVRASISN